MWTLLLNDIFMRRYYAIMIMLTLLIPPLGKIMAEKTTNSSDTLYTDTIGVVFSQSKWNLDLTLGDNASQLRDVDKRLSTVINDSVFRLLHVEIIGGASPEGPLEFNKFLSEHRAATLFEWFDKYKVLNDLDKNFIFLGRDWDGVLIKAKKDTQLPYRDETLSLLESIAGEKKRTGGEPKGSLEKIKQLRGGIPYRHLYDKIFPDVRASKIIIRYERVPSPEIREKKTDVIARRDTVFVERLVEIRDTLYVDTCKKIKR